MKNTIIAEIDVPNEQYQDIREEVNETIKRFYLIIFHNIHQIIYNEFKIQVQQQIRLVIDPKLKDFIAKIKFYDNSDECFIEINKEQLEAVILFSNINELPQDCYVIERSKEYGLFNAIILKSIKHELTHWFCFKILRSDESNDRQEVFEKRIVK